MMEEFIICCYREDLLFWEVFCFFNVVYLLILGDLGLVFKDNRFLIDCILDFLVFVILFFNFVVFFLLDFVD